jgi:hypothetical protein
MVAGHRQKRFKRLYGFLNARRGCFIYGATSLARFFSGHAVFWIAALRRARAAHLRRVARPFRSNRSHRQEPGCNSDS